MGVGKSGLRATFSAQDFRTELNKRIKIIDKKIILRLRVLGEELVNFARSVNTYKDQTGNLRSSIGYLIIANGMVQSASFVQSGSGKVINENGKKVKGGKNGVSVGRALADSLASKYSKGYGLVIVAGMDYADEVESKGYDVLGGAEILAEKEIPKLKVILMNEINGL